MDMYLILKAEEIIFFCLYLFIKSYRDFFTEKCVNKLKLVDICVKTWDSRYKGGDIIV